MRTRRQRVEAAADSLVQDAINDFNGPNSTRFLGSLPVEITVKIGWYLNQLDCLKCMTVCRGWRISAPQYMQRTWKYVYMSYRDVSKSDMRWEHCVRNYGKNIVLSDTKYDRLHFILRKLIDYHCPQIDSVEMRIPDKISAARICMLLSLLKMIADGTPRLIFNDTNTNMNVLDAISAFPDLIQLSYIGITVNWRVNALTQQPVLPHLGRLTHLYLDFPVNMKLQLEPILRNSPNLQNLAYGVRKKESIYLRPPAHTLTNLEDVSSWCQRLTYLESSGGCLSANYRFTWLADIEENKSTHSGLRCFIACQSGGYGPQQVGPHLSRNASTLEFIGLEYIPHEIPLMNQLCTPHLRVLVLHLLNQDDQPAVSGNIVLPVCPALEHLCLNGSKANQLDLSALIKLKQLKHLELSHLSLRNHNHEKLKTWVWQNSRISAITLDAVHSANDMLLDLIAHFSMLERLRIVFRNTNDYSDNGLLQFVDQLGQTAIQDIDLDSIARAPPPFLQAIGDLPTLQSFIVRGGGSSLSHLQVDASAIVKMFEATTSLKRVHLERVVMTEFEEEIATYLEHRIHGYNVNVAIPYPSIDVITVLLKRR
ncbi:hypothetical protein BJV82DRAFT_401287 [Fennellomyces sp. T-0311]|nr:hypothetical protein BJV82DRAFT_401287 [Fennellomyces sp. T-0311]